MTRLLALVRSAVRAVSFVLLALLVLTAEWLVYERDTLARLRRSLAARLGRPSSTPGRNA
jgi:hypothetical protein